MTISGLKSSPEWHTEIDNEIFDLLYWKNETSLDKICAIAKEKIYAEDLKNSTISEKVVNQKIESLKHAFASVVHKFQNIPRNTGWDYFEHQLRVAYNILYKSRKPTLRKLLIALHHDSIEDTDFWFSTLEETLDEKVALWVLSISKKPFWEFIKKWVNFSKNIFLNKEQIQEIKDSEILNEEWDNLSIEYLEKKYNSPENITQKEKELELLWLNSISDYDKFRIIQSTKILNRKWLLSDKYREKKKVSPDRITPEEKWAEELYSNLKKQYKDLRNDEYFSHMLEVKDFDFKYSFIKETSCLNNFFNHVILLSKKEYLLLTQEELQEIALDALEVKFFDRLDNLETTEYYKEQTPQNLKKANDKIKETEKYFYKIANEFDSIEWTEFASMLFFEVERLKNFIKEKEFQQTINQSKWWVEWTLAK